jgi:L-threonylcarbamoyladenylate synthase
VVASRETLEKLGGVNVKTIPYGSKSNLFEIAKNIFKILRELDREGVDIAIVESVEEKGLGLAVMNRLRKAASKIIKTTS